MKLVRTNLHAASSSAQQAPELEKRSSKSWVALAFPLIFGMLNCGNLAPELVTSGSADCPSGSCYADDAGNTKSESSTDAGLPDSSKDAQVGTLNPLCGTGCMPNNGPQACSPSGDAAATQADAGTVSDAQQDVLLVDGAAQGDSAVLGDGGAADAGWLAADSGDASNSGNMGSSGGSGNYPAPEPDNSPILACQVIAGESGPKAECVLGGVGQTGDACESSLNCSPGLTCVGNQAAGVCRAYCCLSPEGCAKGSYCAERQAKTGSSVELVLPVCVPAEECELLRPDACPKDLACSIVRADGTTACVAPGNAKSGEACPCASGYVCAQATDTCMKLCHTNTTADDECDDGICQGGTTGIPDGFGVCVGAKSK